MKSFEQIGYAIYKAVSAFLGCAEEAWEDLPELDKEAWLVAAKAAHKEISEVH